MCLCQQDAQWRFYVFHACRGCHYVIVLAMVVTNAVRKVYRRRKAPVGVKRVSSKDVEVMLAKKVQRLEKSMRIRKPEEKFLDTSLSASNVADSTGSVQSIVSVAAGESENGRVGDSIRVHRIRGHGRVSTQAASLGSAPNNDEFARMHIVQDRQQVADTAPGAGTIFASTAGVSTLLNEGLSHKRFNVLGTSPLFSAARLSPISNPVSTIYAQTPTQTGVWEFDIKCNIVVSYNGTGAGDFEKNGIFFVYLTNIAADTADFDGTLRIYYTDC